MSTCSPLWAAAVEQKTPLVRLKTSTYVRPFAETAWRHDLCAFTWRRFSFSSQALRSLFLLWAERCLHCRPTTAWSVGAAERGWRRPCGRRRGTWMRERTENVWKNDGTWTIPKLGLFLLTRWTTRPRRPTRTSSTALAADHMPRPLFRASCNTWN